MTKSSPILQISGDSGGGQLLRSSLSLSLATGQPFRMTSIRGKRPKPGLMRQLSGGGKVQQAHPAVLQIDDDAVRRHPLVDDAAIMDRGQVVLSGRPDELDDQDVRRYLTV